LHEKSEILQSLVSIEDTVSDSLGRALWDANTPQARAIIEGILRLPFVEGVRVLDSQGALVEQGGYLVNARGTTILVNAEGDVAVVDDPPRVFEHAFPLMFDRGDRVFPVGQASLFTSTGVILRRIEFDVLSLALTVLIQGMVFGLVFLIVTRKLLTRPLADLTKATQGVRMDTLETASFPIDTKIRDELTVLAESFNRMTRDLLASRRQFQDLNRTLVLNRAELERRVEERTEALTQANAWLTREIKEREQAQQALALSEANYRSIFDNANDAIFVHEVQSGAILNVNARMLEMYGYDDKEDVIGARPWKISGDGSEHAQKTASENFRKAAGGAPQLFEWRARGKGGRQFWVEVNLKRTRVGGQDVILAIVRDIDARKKADLTLIESEGKYRALFENEIDAIMILDAEAYTFFDVNDAWLRLYGYAREELGALTAEDVSAEPEKTKQSIGRAVVSRSVYIPKRRHRRKDGTVFWVDVSSGPMTIMGKTLIYAIMRDITERVEAQDALKASEEELQAIFTSMTDLILILDKTGRYLKVSNAAPSARYRPRADLLGKTINEVFSPEEAAFFMAGIHRCLDENTLVTLQYSRDVEGQTIWFDARIAPMSNDTVLFVARDITEIKQFEERLRAAKEAAETANVAKSHFLANMSHEIRTPLNAILGLNHLAQQTDLTERQRDYLRKVDGSADTLLRLIDDILDFSKIEAGRVDMVAVDFSLRKVLANVDSVIRSRSEEKGLTFALCISNAVPDWFRGDPVRLEQVLMNLGINAVKFTHKGGVTVSVAADGEGGDSGPSMLRFTVSDTGVGISEEQAGLLFRPFYQADSSSTRSHGGTGLGLAICKRLVEMMGGGIAFESVEGEGSTFTFTTAFERTDGAVRPDVRLLGTEAVADLLVDMRILIVEDNDINLQVSKEVLEQAGATVSVALNGLQAVDLAFSQPFDAILMDLQMPVMDGLTAAREIRKRISAADLPIIALTANAMIEDWRKCLDAGMNAHVPKPIRPRTLYGTLLRLVRPDALDKIAVERALPGGLQDVPVIDGLDTAVGLLNTNHNPALYMKILRRFHLDHRDNAADIDAALRRGDPATARRLAHNIKSLAGTVGAQTLRATAGALEAAIERGDVAEIEPWYQAFSADMETLMGSLETALEDDTPGGAPGGDSPDEGRASALAIQLRAHIKDGRSDALAGLCLLKAALGQEEQGGHTFQDLEQRLVAYEFDEAGLALDAIMQERGWSGVLDPR